jgi:carbon monoxide dehydrogenase subunit G
MKLEGDYLFEAPVGEVWKALLDPVVLAAVMPGCEKLDLVDGQYVGDLNIKIGPVQGRFSGKVDLKDMQEPTSYTMLVDGRGQPGFVKATAQVRLESEGEHTRMHYDADAQVGGKIASVGQRLLEASSRAITKQSLEGLNENIKLRFAATQAGDTEPEPVAVVVAPAAATNGTANDVTTLAPVLAPAPVVTRPKPVVPPPVVKSIDQKALAAAVAKEVADSLFPRPAVFSFGVAVGAVFVWFLTHH